MQRIAFCLPLLLFAQLFALPAVGGNWGENWGTLTWGAAIAAVPTMGKLGVLALALGFGGLAARFIQRGRAAASVLVIGLVLPMLSPVANAQPVSVPSTFTNGSVADADAMNENFAALRTGVNAALTTAPVGPLIQFNNGMTADADEVNANFQDLLDGVNTALSNRAADCGSLGGSWSTAESTCTLGSPDYDCWRGGMCGVDSGFNYAGSTWEDETLTGTVCNDTAVGRARWNYGVSTAGPTLITAICLWGLAEGKDCYRAGLCGSEGLNYTGSDYHGATQVGSGCDAPPDAVSWDAGVLGVGYATDAALICLTY